MQIHGGFFMKGLKIFSSILNILANIGQMITIAIQTVFGLMVGLALLGAGGYIWLAVSGSIFLFIVGVFNLIFGLILSKKRFANLIMLFAGGLAILVSVLLVVLVPGEEQLIVQYEDPTSLYKFINFTKNFLGAHIVFGVIYLFKMLFNREYLTKQQKEELSNNPSNSKIYCPNCGKENDTKNLVCKKCGENL
jgi:hypothetical protein